MYTYIHTYKTIIDVDYILNKSTLRDFISGPTWKSTAVSKVLAAHSRWNWSPVLYENWLRLWDSLISLFPFLFRNCFKERCKNQIYSGDSRLLQVWKTRLSFRFLKILYSSGIRNLTEFNRLSNETIYLIKKSFFLPKYSS